MIFLKWVAVRIKEVGEEVPCPEPGPLRWVGATVGSVAGGLGERSVPIRPVGH